MTISSETDLPEGVGIITDGDEVVGFVLEEGLVLSDEEEARVNAFLAAHDMPPLPERS